MTGDSEAVRCGRLRRMLLALLVLGMAGTTAELLLLGHTESLTQWIPVAVLGLGFVCAAAVAVRPVRRSLRLFRGVMGLFVAVGLVGLYLHYRGNRLFELEMDPGARGFALVREALTGATPALAPAAMIWFGLLGLVYAHGHPAERQEPRRPDSQP